MPSEKKLLPHRPATLEAIDELLSHASNQALLRDCSVCEMTLEAIYGDSNDNGMLLDILILARVALVHLRGASFLVHENSKHEETQEL